MRTLDEAIETVHQKLDGIIVPKTSHTLMDYIHGRCHIFAQALHEELGYEMEFLWDNDFWFEGVNTPSIVLVHAYCTLPKGVPFKGKYVDARGAVSKRMIEYEYECNSYSYEAFSLDQLHVAYQHNTLEKPTKAEIHAIRNYIRENIKYYK